MLLTALIGFFARFWYAFLSSMGIDLYSPLSLLRTVEALVGTSNRRRGQWCDSEPESVGAQRDKQSPALQWNTTYLDPAPRLGLGGVHPNATRRDETLCLEKKGPSRSLRLANNLRPASLSASIADKPSSRAHMMIWNVGRRRGGGNEVRQGGRGEVARLMLGRGGAGWQRRGRPEDGRRAPRKGVTRSGRGRIVVALRGRCEAAGTGALTELSGSVEKCECRGGKPMWQRGTSRAPGRS